MFNGDTPNQHSLLSWTSLYYLKLWPYGRQMAQHISWSQDHFTSLYISKSILWTSTLVWTAPDKNKIITIFPSEIMSLQSHYKFFQRLDCRHSKSFWNIICWIYSNPQITPTNSSALPNPFWCGSTLSIPSWSLLRHSC